MKHYCNDIRRTLGQQTPNSQINDRLKHGSDGGSDHCCTTEKTGEQCLQIRQAAAAAAAAGALLMDDCFHLLPRNAQSLREIKLTKVFNSRKLENFPRRPNRLQALTCASQHHECERTVFHRLYTIIFVQKSSAEDDCALQCSDSYR